MYNFKLLKTNVFVDGFMDVFNHLQYHYMVLKNMLQFLNFLESITLLVISGPRE